MKPAQITSIRVLGVCALCLAAVPASAARPVAERAGGALFNAENALAAGDCRLAMAGYREVIATLDDPDVVERATEAALDCGQYPLAGEFARRWQSLAPGKARASLAEVRADLGEYRIAPARSIFSSWLVSKQGPDAEAVRGAISLLEDGAGAGATLAMMRGLRQPLLRDPLVQERLAVLAFDGFDYKLALAYADAAKGDEDADRRAALQAVVARAAAGLGQAEVALKAADAAAGSPALVDTRIDVLLLLGRDDEARSALLKLRADPQYTERAERRLAQLSVASGDYADAERRLNALLRSRGSAAFALYYLGILAERAGDADSALQRYELLAGSELDAAARQRVAGIYFRDNERSQAAQMLAARDDASITERIAAVTALTDLYSTNGAHADALARLDQAAERFPDNPDLEYQRSVLQARANMGNEAITTLEQLYKSRPDDPNISNALGYTLADYQRDLPRAQKLIESALAVQPDNPAIQDSMGWVLFRRGHARDSLSWFERSWRLLHQADIGAHWGEALWSLDRKSEARAVWQRALAADPEDQLVIGTAKRFGVDLQPPRARRPLANGPSTSI